MTQNDALEISCLNCIHREMCTWKGCPYSGTTNFGFPAYDYDLYRQEWYQLHARHCRDFSLERPCPLQSHIFYLNSIVMLRTGNPLFTRMVERYAERHGLELKDLEGKIVGYPEGTVTI